MPGGSPSKACTPETRPLLRGPTRAQAYAQRGGPDALPRTFVVSLVSEALRRFPGLRTQLYQVPSTRLAKSPTQATTTPPEWAAEQHKIQPAPLRPEEAFARGPGA